MYDHRVSHTEGPLPFFGPVAGPHGKENTVAHGGVVYIETCDCGMERRVVSNQGQREHGPWGEGREARKARVDRRMGRRRHGRHPQRRRRRGRRRGALRARVRDVRLQIRGANSPTSLVEYRTEPGEWFRAGGLQDCDLGDDPLRVVADWIHRDGGDACPDCLDEDDEDDEVSS